MTNREWYNIRNNSELQHAVGQRKNHKYIARIADSTGKKFRYFYDQAELAAYNSAKKVGNTIDTKITGKTYKKAKETATKRLFNNINNKFSAEQNRCLVELKN